jgi:hypothetical protein
LAVATSCEKVIDLPLNEADQRIVVEAVGRNFEGESYVLLSRTGSVYDDNGFEKLSGAAVTVTDKDGVEVTFEEDPLVAGRYLAPTFQTTPNNQYNLSIAVDGQNLTATGKTLSAPVLDSLTYIPQFGGFGGASADTTFLLFYNFTDNGAEENYYRVRAWVNGERDDNFYIGDDVLGNGQTTAAPLFATTIKSQDTVFVELLSMDEETYKYLFTLSSNLTQGAFSATPANPVSNIEGDAIGVFSMYMVDTMSIIIP